MKKFIKNSLKFLLFTSVFLLIHIMIIYVFNSKIESNYNFEIDTSPKYVVFGHSHPACAFDETLINDFYNGSAAGERFFYTYIKLKKFLDDNESVEVVFIEFDDVQISKVSDSNAWNDVNLDQRFGKFSPIMNWEEHLFLLERNPLRYLRSFLSLPKKQYSRIKNKQYNFNQFRDFSAKDKSGTQSINSVENDAGNVNVSCDFKLSTYNLEYLDKCINYCHKKNKQVVLIRSPIHNQRLTDCVEKQYKELLNKRYSTVSFLDFKEFPLDDGDFLDYGHLNQKGAKRFSIWFNIILEEGLLYKKSRQRFINQRLPK